MMVDVFLLQISSFYWSVMPSNVHSNPVNPQNCTPRLPGVARWKTLKHSTRRDVSAVHLPYDNSHSVYPLLGYSRLAASKHDSRWLKHIEARNNQVRRLFMPQDNGRSVLGLSKIGHFSSFLPCFLSRLSMQIQLPWLWSSSFWEASQTHCLTPLSCKSKVSKGLVTSLIGKSMGNLKPCYHVRLFV